MSRVPTFIAIQTFFLLIMLATSTPCFSQKEGKAWCDSMLMELPKLKSDTNKVRFIAKLCWEYAEYDAPSAVNLSLAGLHLAEKLGDKYGQGLSHVGIGGIYDLMTNGPEATDHYLIAQPILEEIGEYTLLCTNYLFLGMSFLNVDPGILFIRCFPGPLNQVFMNLLNNAIDAIGQKQKKESPGDRTAPDRANEQVNHMKDQNPPGYSGLITITTRLISEGIKTEVQIMIADNGTGIPAEIRDKIFDPFFTTKEVGKGTGLGLSICLGIVEKHEGRITFDSKWGEGCSFVVTLPKYM